MIKKITISTPSVKSTIYCGAGAFIKRVQPLAEKKPFIVTDSNVNKIYGELIKEKFPDSKVCVVPAGEKSKNYNQLLAILKSMIEGGVTRSSTVVALGGGVIGDMAGLAASLYMRGVSLVQIPTTLLAQVDSSVGGKTAIDCFGVKNVIGAFYQPQEVIVDPMFLKTLPKRELRCGLGEIVKYGALDSNIYQYLLDNIDNLFSYKFMESVTYMCIAHKANVVRKDEKETNGLRKTLNLGHTTGHAFELYYKRKSHGEFVLIGMYYELYIAQKLGVCGGEYADNLYKLIGAVIKNIPAYNDIESAARVAKFDKKNNENTTISMIVPHIEGQSQEIKLPIDEYISLIKECRDSIKQDSIKQAKGE